MRLFDRFGHPLEPGCAVVFARNNVPLVGTVVTIDGRKNPLVLHTTEELGRFVPELHDETLWTDPVEWWLVRQCHPKIVARKKPHEVIWVPTPNPGTVRGYVRQGDRLVVDWRSIPAKYTHAAMDQDLTVWAYQVRPGDRLPSQYAYRLPSQYAWNKEVAGHRWVPNPHDTLVPTENFWDADVGFWVDPKTESRSHDALQLAPEQVISRPPYHAWCNTLISRPQ